MLEIKIMTGKETNLIGPNTKVSANHGEQWPEVCGCRAQPKTVIVIARSVSRHSPLSMGRRLGRMTSSPIFNKPVRRCQCTIQSQMNGTKAYYLPWLTCPTPPQRMSATVGSIAILLWSFSCQDDVTTTAIDCYCILIANIWSGQTTLKALYNIFTFVSDWYNGCSEWR